MRQILLVLLAFFLLNGLVSGIPDSAITGQYKISFDLGLTHDAYNITVNDPVIDETLGGANIEKYSITITLKNETARTDAVVYVKKLEEPLLVTGQMILQVLMELENNPFSSGVHGDVRTIDGTPGAVVLGYTTTSHVTFYHAMYMMPSDPTSSTNVEIGSNLPWDKGTLQLLKTIHVENVT